MRVGIDFDRVLFDTNSFKDFLNEQIPGFLETYPETEIYDPERHASILDVDEERIYDTMHSLHQFVIDDADKLSDVEADIIIVSRGRQSFQLQKIINSEIITVIDEYVVIQDGSKERRGIEALIDDRQDEIARVDIPTFLFDYSVHSVEDIIAFINSLE